MPSGELVTVSPPLYGDLQKTNAWAAAREPQLRHWNWHVITQQHTERFAVWADDEELVALWAGRGTSSDGQRLWYALDFVEVAPERRGEQVWGPMTIALIVGRARECGASGLALGALPERARWYRRLGAADAYNWPVDDELIPMTIGNGAFDALLRILDERREN